MQVVGAERAVGAAEDGEAGLRLAWQFLKRVMSAAMTGLERLAHPPEHAHQHHNHHEPRDVEPRAEPAPMRRIVVVADYSESALIALTTVINAIGVRLLALINNAIGDVLKPDPCCRLNQELLPVSRFTMTPLVMVTHPSLKTSTIIDYVQLAKQKPGGLTYASAGPGSLAQERPARPGNWNR